MGVIAYTVRGPARKKSQLILVESDVSTLPVRAGKAEIEKAASELREALQPVAATIREVLDVLATAGPQETTIDFGVNIGAKAGFPTIVSASGNFHFKVQLTWKKSESSKEK